MHGQQNIKIFVIARYKALAVGNCLN